jgi:hypothetical protein
MKHKKLKRGIYTSPQSGTKEIERYVIENEQDLKAFAKAFPRARKFFEDNMRNSLAQGYIIIATDEHELSGLPTYCFESKDPNNTHPSSFHRVRLIENK